LTATAGKHPNVVLPLGQAPNAEFQSIEDQSNNYRCQHKEVIGLHQAARWQGAQFRVPLMFDEEN